MSLQAFRFLAGAVSPLHSWADDPLLGAEPGGGVASASDADIDLGTTPGYGTWLEYARNGFQAAELRSFGTDWYDRLHLSEAAIGLGNVIGNQERTVNVWNAFRRAQPLAGLASSNAEGLNLTGQPAPPLDFAPLQECTYTLEVSTSGPPTIDATFTWDFAPYDLVLRVTGSRITAWSFAPDWSRPIIERLEWKTDVLQAYNATEQRRSVRLAPRKSYEFEAFFEGKARRYAEALMWGWGARTWALPVWPDGVDLQSPVSIGDETIALETETRDFTAGGFAIILGDAFTFEVLELQAVHADSIELKRGATRAWPAGTRLFPARVARIDGQSALDRWDGQASGARVQFAVVGAVDYAADAGSATYRGHAVLERRPDWSGGFDLELGRKLAEIDNLTGVRSFDDEAGIPLTLQRMRWLLATRADQEAFRRMLYALRGRAGALWVPTWEDDLRVTALIGDTSQTIDVEFCAYAAQFALAPGRRDIRIELVDGTIFYRRLLGAQEIDGDTERLGIDTPLGRNVSPGDVAKVSFLTLCRLESDAIELAHWTGETCESSTSFRSFRSDA